MTTRELVVPGLVTITVDEHGHLIAMLDPKHDGKVDLKSLDLDDNHQDWAPGLPYFDSAKMDVETNVIRGRKLVETLAYYDHDNDGVFDGDEAIELIQQIVGKKLLIPFERPRGTLWLRICTRLMPDAPERHNVQSFGELKWQYRWWHYAIVVPTMAMFVLIAMVQIHYFPWMEYAPATAVVALAEHGGGIGWSLSICLAAAFYLLFFRYGTPATDGSGWLSDLTKGLLSKFAESEEQQYREGSEAWGWGNRLRSCLVFGLVHQANLIYPLASILPLAFGGAVFMAHYLFKLKRTRNRRTAVLASSVLHRVYNRVALAVIVILLLRSNLERFFGISLLGMTIGGAVLVLIGMALTDLKRRKLRS